jgi:erythronate-4-phosphate dehydrogenase
MTRACGNPADLSWVIDEAIPITASLKQATGNALMVSARDITPAIIEKADGLLVRSVTQVDEALLAGSAVRFVGTATAGIDHLDAAALARLGVQWASAPGSNATAVVEYVLSAIALSGHFQSILRGTPVGIVGLGAVGGQLAQRLVSLGCQVVGYDPLVTHWPPGVLRGDLEAVLSQAVVSLHASLHDQPSFASQGLMGVAEVESMIVASATRSQPGLFINAGRGGLVTHQALECLLASAWTTVLDTWPTEPFLDGSLLAQCDWVSPHIAGHSKAAKRRGSDMLASAVAQWGDQIGLARPVIGAAEITQEPMPPTLTSLICEAGEAPGEVMERFLHQSSVLAREDARLRQGATPHVTTELFDRLRQSYEQPAEWTGAPLQVSAGSTAIMAALKNLGIAVI